MARIMAISSSPICEGPSSPIDTPQCDPAYLIVTPEIAAIRMWSNARLRKAANVDTKGIFPHAAKTNRSPYHILLGDKALEVPILMCGKKLLRKGRVFGVAVERNNKGITESEFR